MDQNDAYFVAFLPILIFFEIVCRLKKLDLAQLVSITQLEVH